VPSFAECQHWAKLRFFAVFQFLLFFHSIHNRQHT